jgi:glycosyltransferase involved in cell wall biosynthesis
MRILMTTDTVGGGWNYCMELTSALAAHDVELCLATLGAPLSQAQRLQVSRLANVRLFESHYRLEWMADAWSDVRDSARWLHELAQRVRPDVVHLNGYAHGQIDFEVPVLMVGHSCVLSWWQAVRRDDAPSEWNRYEREVSFGMRGADLLVAPSHAMLAELRRHYAPLPPHRVIYNGRDPSHFRPQQPKQAFVFAAGRLWDEAKNVAALERVAPSLDWPVMLAGETASPSSGGARRASNVQMLGRLNDAEVAAQMARAAIYALPARYEPFGLSILEAALSGCALVLGDIPSLREIWGPTAVYVPPDDHQALKSALQELIANASRREQFAKLSRALRYSHATMAAQYLQAYQALSLGSLRPLLADDEAAATGVDA